MAHTKQPSKRKRRSKAVPVLGAAGLSLSLASGAPAAIGAPTADELTRSSAVNHEITLGEEDISGVSLATFHLSDKETGRRPQPRVRFAACGCGSGCGCGGCGCWTGTYYSSSVVGGEGNQPYYSPNYPPQHPHKHKHAAKRAHAAKK